MNSQRAQEFIEKSKFEKFPYSYNQKQEYLISSEDAEKAIEITEKEIIEKAITVLEKVCPYQNQKGYCNEHDLLILCRENDCAEKKNSSPC